MSFLRFLAALAVAAAPLSAAPAAAPTPEEGKKAKTKRTVVCKRVADTGSHARVSKTCTAARRSKAVEPAGKASEAGDTSTQTN